jgi:hypothetical protein
MHLLIHVYGVKKRRNKDRQTGTQKHRQTYARRQTDRKSDGELDYCEYNDRK